MKATVAELRERANTVLQKTDLSEIRLSGVNARSSNPVLSGVFNVEVEMQLKAADRPADGELDVFARYVATAAVEDDPEVEAWRVAVDQVATYKKGSGDPIDEKDALSFAIIVGIMNLHPFARETVQNVVVRMGYPSFTLDMVSPVGALPDDELIELEGE